MEVPSPAGLGVGDVNFPRTRLLCDGCPPLGWDRCAKIIKHKHNHKQRNTSECAHPVVGQVILFSTRPVEFDAMTLTYNNVEFDTYSAESKQLYSLLITNKAKYPGNRLKTLSADLELSDPLHEVFLIPYNMAGDYLLMSFSEIGKRPPQFCEATFIAQEILDSGFQFDMGEMYYNWFKSVVSYRTQRKPLHSFDTLNSISGEGGLQFSFNRELPQESRLLGIKDRVKMAKGALNLTKATSSTQNADLMEALLLPFEEKMERKGLTSSQLSLSSTGSTASPDPSLVSTPSTTRFSFPLSSSTPSSCISLPFSDAVSPISPPHAEHTPQRIQITTPLAENE
ncbi:ATP synthase subunit gamma, mitochondrial [Stylophora pistillata]|uniref:ATP synthase subunit gamma, mitochondrial n=1 Tax=Stylophora pistillata TaxID=50429 RepID=A0A2B4REX4_STYPI|nr:ATP synthase subunit gamma, mitochondrial [Stylophora pistillata]